MSGEPSPAILADVQDYLRSLPLLWSGPVERPDLVAFSLGNRRNQPDARGVVWLTDDELATLRKTTRPSEVEKIALASVVATMLGLHERIMESSNAGMRASARRRLLGEFASVMRAILSQPRSWADFGEQEYDAIDALVAAANNPLGNYFAERLELAARRFAAAGVCAFSLGIDADNGLFVAAPLKPRAAFAITIREILKFSLNLSPKSVNNRMSERRKPGSPNPPPEPLEKGRGSKQSTYDYSLIRTWLEKEFPARAHSIPENPPSVQWGMPSC